MNDVSARNQVIYDSELLARVDRERREQEIAAYREQPSQKMPVMLPVQKMGAHVLWPSKFR